MSLRRAFLRSVSMAVPLVATLLIWVTPAFPHAGNFSGDLIHACVGRHSQVVRIVGVNGHCVSHHGFLAETPTHWPAVVSAPAPSAPSAGALRYVDSSIPEPKTVGIAVGVEPNQPAVAIDLPNGTLVTAQIGASDSFNGAGFLDNFGDATFFYTDVNCGIPASGFLDGRVASNRAFANLRDSTLTYTDLSAAATIAIRSFKFGSPAQCFTIADQLGVESMEMFVAPAVTVPLSDLDVNPPFRLAK